MGIVEGVVDEDSCRQFGVVQVASAQLRTAYPQFACLTVSHGLSVFSNDIQAVSATCLTNGNIFLTALYGITRNHAASL